MDITFLLRGVAIGLAIAAPVGPIGLLCIRRTLTDGRLYGFVSGMGAATADMLYGCVAAFGLTAVSAVLVSQQTWLRVVGGVVLCYLGVCTFISHPADASASPLDSNAVQTSPPKLVRTSIQAVATSGFVGAYLSTLFLTLTNPATIFSFAAVFAGLGTNSADGAALTVLGVFIGSALWWLILSGGVSLIRSHITANGLRWVNRLSGICLFVFGSAALVSLAL